MRVDSFLVCFFGWRHQSGIKSIMELLLAYIYHFNLFGKEFFYAVKINSGG